MALLTFLVLNLNGTKTLMGFIRQQAGFCRTQKLKLPSLAISRRVRFAFVQNTSSSDVLGRPPWEAWAPQLECLVARRAPRNFYAGDQLWGLGNLNKMLGNPKGSLKFSLEHSLGPIWIMAEKCLTSNVAVFTGYWIVFSRSAELIYEIRNWREGLHSHLEVYSSRSVQV